MFTKEPTVFLKVIEEIVRAAIPMALIFGWVAWTDEQTGAVMLFVGVVVGGLSMLLTRTQVVPTQIADKQIEVALTQPASTSVKAVQEMAKDK